MTNINEILGVTGPRIEEAFSNFFIPLQTVRVVNRDAFEELDRSVKLLAKQLNGHVMVPKSLLNAIYASMQILRNEAPYFKGDTAMLEAMANQMETTLALILLGESHDDRTPGVPRIL
jgi:hypothetical protein